MRILDPQSLSQHIDRLYRAAWGLCGSREDAEDLVQETFARVLSRPRVLQGDDELYYLLRVLRNTFLTGRRTASRRPQTVAPLEDVVTADAKPIGRPDEALEIQEVYGAISQLPQDFRDALVAVDVVGLSYRQAARALGVREATITTRLFRARKQVAAKLAPTEPGAGARRAQGRSPREGASGGQAPPPGEAALAAGAAAPNASEAGQQSAGADRRSHEPGREENGPSGVSSSGGKRLESSAST
jgi:RNA polymerase sigma-70 factor, ECF subfamily